MSMSDEQKTQAENEAIDRLLSALPHILVATQMAQDAVPDGKVCLAIVAKKPDGSGQLTASFECEEFFKDILMVLGLGTPEQFLEDQALLEVSEVTR